MNLPNKLTMMRVIMVPFFMVFAAMSHMGTPQFNATYALIAGILFAVASFTDFLDGYLARKNHLVTDFGKFMDPLADKMLTTAAIIYMVVDGVCSPVVLAIIMFREFAVAGVRMIAAESGTVIAANMWGKVGSCGIKSSFLRAMVLKICMDRNFLSQLCWYGAAKPANHSDLL